MSSRIVWGIFRRARSRLPSPFRLDVMPIQPRTQDPRRFIPAGSPASSIRARVIAALLLALLLGTLAVAALTRPIDRLRLPRTLDELHPELQATHHGDPPCVRWAPEATLTPHERDALLTDLSAVLAVDLRVLLPTLAAIRLANHHAAQEHHGASPLQEVAAVATRRLGAIDQLRVELRPERLREVLPRLEQLEEQDRRNAQDARRVQRLRARLSPEDQRRFDAFVERWRAPLASRTAQVTLLDHVAERVTLTRLHMLQQGLRSYRLRFGSWPSTLQTLLSHLRAEEGLDPTLERGLAPDGSLRDGWLRPFTYYMLGAEELRLVSEGPSEHTAADDLTFSSTGPLR